MICLLKGSVPAPEAEACKRVKRFLFVGAQSRYGGINERRPGKNKSAKAHTILTGGKGICGILFTAGI